MLEKRQPPIGKTIKRVAAGEFWFEGELSCPCCPIYIEDEDGKCWKLSLNDENYEWDLLASSDSFPRIGNVIDDGDMVWRDVAVENSARLVGQKIISLVAFYPAGKRCIILKCENDWVILGVSFNATEREEFHVVKIADCAALI